MSGRPALSVLRDGSCVRSSGPLQCGVSQAHKSARPSGPREWWGVREMRNEREIAEKESYVCDGLGLGCESETVESRQEATLRLLEGESGASKARDRVWYEALNEIRSHRGVDGGAHSATPLRTAPRIARMRDTQRKRSAHCEWLGPMDRVTPLRRFAGRSATVCRSDGLRCTQRSAIRRSSTVSVSEPEAV